MDHLDNVGRVTGVHQEVMDTSAGMMPMIAFTIVNFDGRKEVTEYVGLVFDPEKEDRLIHLVTEAIRGAVRTTRYMRDSHDRVEDIKPEDFND